MLNIARLRASFVSLSLDLEAHEIVAHRDPSTKWRPSSRIKESSQSCIEREREPHSFELCPFLSFFHFGVTGACMVVAGVSACRLLSIAPHCHLRRRGRNGEMATWGASFVTTGSAAWLQSHWGWGRARGDDGNTEQNERLPEH